jgi:leucyl aminopeptidase
LDIGAARDSLPLTLLFEGEVEAWVARQESSVATQVREQCFTAERGRVLLLWTAQGSLAGAVAGLGRRTGSVSLWHTSGLADRLPARRFHLTNSFSAAEATQAALGFGYGTYRFDRYRRPKSSESRATLEPGANADREYLRLALEATTLTRDYINTPASDFGPAELAGAVRALAERHGASFQEWTGEELLEARFPAVYAVGKGSSRAPRFAELRWAPPGAGDLPLLVLIGKGVCFDSGGLDLKTAQGMALMKKDMGGAAIVLGLAHMLMSSKVRARLIVMIPAVENSVSAEAYRPGDVLQTRKGLTVEVGNTDAEGRLILCDALAAADALKPDLIVDAATLTGAARVALGPELPAIFGSDADLVQEAADISTAEHDPLWPMPLWMGYDDDFASKVADISNDSGGAFAGSIIAALFLRRFVTESPRWLHLDVYAWNPQERPGRPVGAEPQGLRGLYCFLMHRYGA